jgi:AcrR family transcriptional regulator
MASIPLRKDSARTRQTILTASEDLLAADAGASFAEISIAAGVSQATVYRHFADRPSLLIALMERSLEEIETELGTWQIGPDTFEALLELASKHQARYQGVLFAVRRGEVDGPKLAELEARTQEMFRRPFALAQEAGRLRAEIEIDDVIRLLAMVDGAISAYQDPASRTRAAEKALGVVINGVMRT